MTTPTVAFFDNHLFEQEAFEKINSESTHPLGLTFFPFKLDAKTAILAKGYKIVCIFVHDNVDQECLDQLKEIGIKLICIRGAGFNHVNVAHAQKISLPVVRVPSYSPHAVAEHALSLIMTLNRHIIRAHARVREFNFSLNGLVGFDLNGKTVGIVGQGKIGQVFAKIMLGLGCQVLAYDKYLQQSPPISGVKMTSLQEVFTQSDIISLHVPLTPETLHLINKESIQNMKNGVMLINTSRGALIDTKALIDNLKTGKIGFAGLDVYEEEENIFFNDLSGKVLLDDQLARLMTFPNVLITAHQGFLTREALHNIAETTIDNILRLERGESLINLV